MRCYVSSGIVLEAPLSLCAGCESDINGLFRGVWALFSKRPPPPKKTEQNISHSKQRDHYSKSAKPPSA